MLSYDAAEVRILASGVRPWEDATERVCPACGAQKVRFYLRMGDRGGRPTVMGYVWCGNCRRYNGSTGPLQPGLSFDDPFESKAPAWGKRGDEYFKFLDEAWEKGLLPQAFITVPPGTNRGGTVGNGSQK
jgi:hypothetical protein